MTKEHAIAYAVQAYKKTKNQDCDEECFVAIMNALIDQQTGDEAVQTVKKTFERGW